MEELPTEPAGILIQPDFITPQHEQALIQIFQDLPWPSPATTTTTTTTTTNSNSAPKKNTTRRSLHWGHTFCYKTFSIDRAVPHKPFPPWLVPLIPRIPPSASAADEGDGDGGSHGRDPDQVCLQHYPPGAGIPPHADTHSAFDELYALSLGSPVVMQFREGAPSTLTGNDDGGTSDAAKAERRSVDVDLQPRSMMQMRGDARLHWTHGIRKRKTDVLAGGAVRPRRDRWSITYRWLRHGGVCECGDEVLCDTAMRRRGEEREYRWKQQEQDEEQEKQGTAQDMSQDELKDTVKAEVVQTWG